MSSANRSNYWSTRLGFESTSKSATTTTSAAPTATTGGGGGYYINQTLPLDSYYDKKFNSNNSKPSPLVSASITTLSTTPSSVNRDAGRNSNHFPPANGGMTAGGGNGVVPLPMVRTGTLGPNMKQPGIVVGGSPSFPEPSPLTATNLSSYFSNKSNGGGNGNNGLDFASAPSSPVSTCSCQSDPDREALMSAILGVATDEALENFANTNNNHSSNNISRSIDNSPASDNMDIDKILEDDFGGPLENMSRYGGNQHSHRGSLSTTRTQFGTTAQQPQRRHRTYHRSNCIWNKNNFRNRTNNVSKTTADGELEELRRRANLVLKRRQLKESLVKKRNQKMVSRDVDHIDLQMCNRREEEQQEKLRVIEERRAKRLAFKTEVKNQRERKAEETEIEAFFLKKYVQTLQHETEEAARHLERGGGPQGGQYGNGENTIISGAEIATGFSFAIGADDSDDINDLMSRVPAEDQKSMCNGTLSPKEYERIMGATSLLLALSTQDAAAPLTTSKSRKSVSMATATSSAGSMPSFLDELGASDKEGEESMGGEQDDEDDNMDESFDYNFDFETCTEKTRGAASLLVHKYVSYFRIDIHQTHRDEYKNVRKELTEAQDALLQQENRLGKINNKLRQNVAEYEARLQREEDARTAIEREAQKAQRHFEKTLKHERQSFWNDTVIKTINELAQSECEALEELLEEARDSHQACLSRCRARVFNEYLTEKQRNELEEGVQDAITKTRNKWITARFSLITLSSEKCVELAHLMLEEAYQAEVAEEHQLRHLHWEMQQAQTINHAASLELNMTPPSSPRAAQIFATEAGSIAAYAAASDTVLKFSSDREIYNTLLMLGIVDNKNHRPNVEMLFGCLNRSSSSTNPASLSCLVNGGGGTPEEQQQDGVEEATTQDTMEAARISAAKRRQRLLQQNLSRITLKSMLSQLAEIAVDLLLSDEEADELDTLLEAAGERQRLQVLDDYAAMDVLRKRLKKRA